MPTNTSMHISSQATARKVVKTMPTQSPKHPRAQKSSENYANQNACPIHSAWTLTHTILPSTIAVLSLERHHDYNACWSHMHVNCVASTVPTTILILHSLLRTISVHVNVGFITSRACVSALAVQAILSYASIGSIMLASCVARLA